MPPFDYFLRKNKNEKRKWGGMRFRGKQNLLKILFLVLIIFDVILGVILVAKIKFREEKEVSLNVLMMNESFNMGGFNMGGSKVNGTEVNYFNESLKEKKEETDEKEEGKKEESEGKKEVGVGKKEVSKKEESGNRKEVKEDKRENKREVNGGQEDKKQGKKGEVRARKVEEDPFYVFRRQQRVEQRGQLEQGGQVLPPPPPISITQSSIQQSPMQPPMQFQPPAQQLPSQIVEQPLISIEVYGLYRKNGKLYVLTNLGLKTEGSILVDGEVIKEIKENKIVTNRREIVFR